MTFKDFSNKNYFWVIISLLALSIFRLLPLLKAPLGYFGYDYGFYLYEIKNAALTHSFAGISGGFNSPLFYLAKILHIPAEQFLTISIFVFTILLGLSFYWAFKNQGNALAGVFAIALTAFSTLQAEAYSMFLYKNLLALPLLVLGFKFAGEKKYKWLAVISVLIILLHRTTAIVYILSIALYFLLTLLIHVLSSRLNPNVSEDERRDPLMHTIICVFICLLLGVLAFKFLHLNSYILLLTSSPNPYVHSGLFFENQNLLVLWWPFLVLGLAGLIKSIKAKQNFIWMALILVCSIFFAFKLPFYRRTLLYADLACIYFSAYFLGQINYQRKIMKLALALAMLYLALNAGQFILNKNPIITKNEVQEIQNFQGKNPGEFVLAITANDAPWLLGYSNNLRLGAPGLFEDRNTFEEWQNFWQGRGQTEFLWRYPRPLYIYQRSFKVVGPLVDCLIPLSPNFFEYVCRD